MVGRMEQPQRIDSIRRRIAESASDIQEVSMRWLIALAAVTVVTPALAEAPHCAIQGPITLADAGPAAAASAPTAPKEAAVPPGAAVATSAAAIPPAPHELPSALAAMPFLQHVAAAGATLFDLGTSHGLHLAAARSGDEFKMFAVLPDGTAAVEGAPVELGVPQLDTIAAGNVTPLGETAGFAGYFVLSGQQFQVFYASPDNVVVVPGILRDAQGKNLTRDQVAKIPGATPTVEVSNGAAPTAGQAAPSSDAAPQANAATLAAVEKADYATLGPALAPQLFMLVDPQCIYSVRSYQILRGYAQSGKIRLSVVPLSVLDYEDHGQSTKSALALLSKPADQLLTAWQFGDVGGPVSPDAASRLKQNMAIADAIGLKGTPTFIWRKSDGTVERIDGVPTDIGALVTSVGS